MENTVDFRKEEKQESNCFTYIFVVALSRKRLNFIDNVEVVGCKKKLMATQQSGLVVIYEKFEVYLLAVQKNKNIS